MAEEMKTIRPLLVPVLLAALAAGGAAQDKAPLPLVPQPRQVRPGSGSLALGGRVAAADKSLAPLAAILSDEILRITGVRLAPAEGKAGPGDVSLAIDTTLKGEEYALDVNGTAAVRGGDYFAVAAGSATLLQLLTASGGKAALPRLSVTDKPAYPYRGLLIDLARKYHTPGGVKQVIELCRFYKIRYLHLHISDDQLFMFRSAKFPQLGRGNREFARFEPASKPRIEPYTIEELKDLERFSQERGVHLVPELDLPGHSGRLVGDAPEAFAFPGNGSTVNIASPKTLEAITALLNEVMDVFQGTPYLHLGADEVGLGGLERTPEYKEAQARLGNIRSPHDLYCKFIADLHAVAARRGKKSIVWEEAWDPRSPYPLPKDTVVMVWSQGRSPVEIAKSGYAVVNATWTPLYIVRDNKRSPEFLFDWEIAKFGREGSTQFTPMKDTERLLGTQLCSWENSESIEIQSARERLAVVSEKAWNPQAGGTYAAFRARWAPADAALDRLVHPVAIEVQGKFTRDENTFEEPITVTLSPRRPGLAVKYTLDNSVPNAGWKAYTGPIRLEQTAHLRAGLFDASDAPQGYLSGAWFRRQIAVKPNLATRKPVTVGPGPDRADAWGAKVAVDGRMDDINAHWASKDPAPQWLQIDLEKVCPVDSVTVVTYYDGGRYYHLDVELSTDAKSWKKVLEFKDTIPATAAGYSGTFARTEARYVRIVMKKNSANAWVHIVEAIVNEAK